MSHIRKCDVPSAIFIYDSVYWFGKFYKMSTRGNNKSGDIHVPGMPGCRPCCFSFRSSNRLILPIQFVTYKLVKCIFLFSYLAIYL